MQFSFPFRQQTIYAAVREDWDRFIQWNGRSVRPKVWKRLTFPLERFVAGAHSALATFTFTFLLQTIPFYPMMTVS